MIIQTVDSDYRKVKNCLNQIGIKSGTDPDLFRFILLGSSGFCVVYRSKIRGKKRQSIRPVRDARQIDHLVCIIGKSVEYILIPVMSGQSVLHELFIACDAILVFQRSGEKGLPAVMAPSLFENLPVTPANDIRGNKNNGITKAQFRKRLRKDTCKPDFTGSARVSVGADTL